MTTTGLRVALVGATGALGGELLIALDELEFPVESLRVFAGESSAGTEIHFRGAMSVVETGAPNLSHTDLAFLCAPPDVSLEWVAAALRAAVPVFDLSGALALREEVTLGVAGWATPAEIIEAPAVGTPAGPALAWLRALLPIHRAAGLVRVVGTSLESVSGSGRAGIETLGNEAVALFNQGDPPPPEVFSQPVAFSCVPELGGLENGHGTTGRERSLQKVLRRVFEDRVEVSVTCVQVPTFAGDGASLHCDLSQPVDLEKLAAAWSDAPGVHFDPEAAAPTTRSAVGTDSVQIGRVRHGSGGERTLALWLVGDPIRLAARNAVELALARVRLH